MGPGMHVLAVRLELHHPTGVLAHAPSFKSSELSYLDDGPDLRWPSNAAPVLPRSRLIRRSAYPSKIYDLGAAAPERMSMMSARMSNPAMLLPDAMKGIDSLYKAMYAGGVPQTTLELVHLRASQINGCSACINAGVASATKAGEKAERLHAVAGWYESSLFTGAERAALRLTEAATRLSDRPGAVTDEIWEEAQSHYDESQLAALILMIATTNLFNRLNTTVREPAEARWA